jgi:general L-amino acid transport system permease protein
MSATVEQHLPLRRNFAPGTPGARAFEWVRRNLFGSVVNTLLTLLVLVLAALILPPLFRWGIARASLSGVSRAACTGDGACWTFIRVRLPLFFYGRYPSSEYWRVDLAGILLVGF